MAGLDAHVQGSVVHNGNSISALLPTEADALGEQESYSIVDFSFGVQRDKWSAEMFVTNAFDERVSLYRYSECDVTICSNPDFGGIVYGIANRPRTIGLKFSQKF